MKLEKNKRETANTHHRSVYKNSNYVTPTRQTEQYETQNRAGNG